MLATTLSLMAVFLPVAFMGGIPGRFLKSFGFTMAFAIGVSLFVSFTLTPMLARALLGGDDHEQGNGARAASSTSSTGRSSACYMAHARAGRMRHRWVIVLACVADARLVRPAGEARARRASCPMDDQAQFEVSVRAPEGTSASETALIAERIAQRGARAAGRRAHRRRRSPAATPQAQNLASIYVALVDPRAAQDHAARS